MISLCLMLGIALSATPAHSQGVDCAFAQPVKAGERAPCNGQLVPRDDAFEALKLKSYTVPLLEHKLSLANDLIAAMKVERDQAVETERKRADAFNNLLIEQIKPIPWYESNQFWYAMGVATTVVVVVALAASR